jgi:hypothetical protein
MVQSWMISPGWSAASWEVESNRTGRSFWKSADAGVQRRLSGHYANGAGLKW